MSRSWTQPEPKADQDNNGWRGTFGRPHVMGRCTSFHGHGLDFPFDDLVWWKVAGEIAGAAMDKILSAARENGIG